MTFDSSLPVFAHVNFGPPAAGAKRSVLIKKIVSVTGKWAKVHFYEGMTDAAGSIPSGAHWTDGTVHVDLLTNEFKPEPGCCCY